MNNIYPILFLIIAIRMKYLIFIKQRDKIKSYKTRHQLLEKFTQQDNCSTKVFTYSIKTHIQNPIKKSIIQTLTNSQNSKLVDCMINKCDDINTKISILDLKNLELNNKYVYINKNSSDNDINVLLEEAAVKVSTEMSNFLTLEPKLKLKVHSLIKNYLKTINEDLFLDYYNKLKNLNKCKTENSDICLDFMKYLSLIQTNYIDKELKNIIEEYEKQIKTSAKCEYKIKEKNLNELEKKINLKLKKASEWKSTKGIITDDLQTKEKKKEYSDRLAKLSLHANQQLQKKKIYELSLSEILINMRIELIILINELPSAKSFNDIFKLLYKNNRFFYVGIFLILVAILSTAMKY